MKIIVIDDEKIKRITMTDALKKAGYNVQSFESPIAAITHLETFGGDLVITDIRMPQMDGFEVLQKVKSFSPSTYVIMITGYGTIQSAVDAMKKGAYDYITKPFSLDHLLLLVSKVKHLMDLERENVDLKEKLHEIYSFHNIIGRSKVMLRLFDQLKTVSKTEMPVLIEGESGTGKEIVANALHYNSLRKDKSFVKLSCAILNESLLESELFGHVKGAFTGAIKDKKGRFEMANGGTLFLDDVDDIPISFQVKLLRVLQEKEFEKVGGDSPVKADVRIIAATKVNLAEKVERNEFREDLFYRLKVIPLTLPPLRERKDDIPLLLEHFARKTGKTDVRFSPEALEALTEYNWPGNVRQLENTFCRIIAFSESNYIKKEMLPGEILIKKADFKAFYFKDAEKINLSKLLDEVEASAINWAFKKADGNQSKAAELLEIRRTTFRDRLLKYDIK
ncbi:MAG: sigma-54-dependent transcriptional regulator [Ignavibacteriaceae bacterium]